MAHRPNLSPGPRNSAASVPENLRLPAEESDVHPATRGAESDIAELFAKFEQNSGGTLTPQFSADLALEIVLNEIAEQACLATGATGAVVVLRRDSEFVCRASTGASAPVLGSRMNTASGLSGLCIRTGKVQRCDDAQNDLRADPEASRSLGVRSVMVVPLAQSTGVMGILEVLSPRSAAFGDRDERTLEALARRVLRNVERAAEPFLLRADTTVVTDFLQPPPMETTPILQPVINEPLSGPIFSSVATTDSRRGTDVLTWLMGLILLACVILVGVLTSRRLGWNLTTLHVHAAKIPALAVNAQQGANVPANSTPDPPTQTDSTRPMVAGGKPASATMQASNATMPSPSIPDGGLRVYENGREVFRLPATPAALDSKDGVVELSPAAAESSVIHRVEPEYPKQAQVQKIQGKVILRVRIHPDGAVGGVELINGEPLLAQAAIDAVKQWRFKVRSEEGNLAEMQTQVTLNFRLPQ